MSLIKKTKALGGKALDSLVDTSPKAFIKGIYNGTGKAVELGFVATGAMAELVSHTISSSKESSSTVGSKVKQNFTTGRALAKEALNPKKPMATRREQPAPQQQEFDFDS